MAPSFTIDNTSDFEMPSSTPTQPASSSRTLLIAPPSVSSHPELLKNIWEAHDRNATDIQMLDRLAMGLVALPAETYDVVLLLTGPDGSRPAVDRTVMPKLVASLKAGGRFRSQDGQFASVPGPEQTESILAGLVKDGREGMLKPVSTGPQTVKLSFGRKKANAAAVPLNPVEAANTNAVPATSGKRKSMGDGPVMPAGVVMVDPNDDIDMDYDDDEPYIPSNEELMNGDTIDPDTLLTEADRQKPIIIRKRIQQSLIHDPAVLTRTQLRHASPTARDGELARTALAA